MRPWPVLFLLAVPGCLGAPPGCAGLASVDQVVVQLLSGPEGPEAEDLVRAKVGVYSEGFRASDLAPDATGCVAAAIPGPGTYRIDAALHSDLEGHRGLSWQNTVVVEARSGRTDVDLELDVPMRWHSDPAPRPPLLRVENPMGTVPFNVTLHLDEAGGDGAVGWRVWLAHENATAGQVRQQEPQARGTTLPATVVLPVTDAGQYRVWAELTIVQGIFGMADHPVTGLLAHVPPGPLFADGAEDGMKQWAVWSILHPTGNTYPVEGRGWQVTDQGKQEGNRSFWTDVAPWHEGSMLSESFRVPDDGGVHEVTFTVRGFLPDGSIQFLVLDEGMSVPLWSVDYELADWTQVALRLDDFRGRHLQFQFVARSGSPAAGATASPPGYFVDSIRAT